MRKRDYIAMIISFIALCFCGVIAITDSYIWHRIAFLMCTVGASMSFGMSFIDFVYYIATRGYKKEKGLGEEKSKSNGQSVYFTYSQQGLFNRAEHLATKRLPFIKTNQGLE